MAVAAQTEAQTLMLKVFLRKIAASATGLWAITILVAPVMGPILSRFRCNNVGRSSNFWINLPIAIICAWFSRRLLKRHETAVARVPNDTVGLIWIGAAA
jgi:MFS transporter, DHA2 family, multidrug resistance protein